jgi:hypothetical protein
MNGARRWSRYSRRRYLRYLHPSIPCLTFSWALSTELTFSLGA